GALDVQAWGAAVEVVDARGRVLARGTGALRAENVPSGPVWIKATGAPGRYVLGAQAGKPAERPDLDAAGALSASSPEQFRGILLPQSSVVRLQLDVGGAGGAVSAVLYDLEGRIAWQAVLEAGRKLDARLFLREGAYTLRLVGGSTDGSPLAALPYRVRTTVMSDPIGPTLPPTGPVPPRTVAPTWYDAGFKIIRAAYDPYGRPVPFTAPPPVVYLPPDKLPKPWK
ncbi:MAG: hypothetical protein K2W96_01040, partial [Gemmataceae bacterium]|nr:hypothetical protein [Gemmataceae bacterium]